MLGVVEAENADQQVALGHARLRCVLAVLLVEANRFVSVDQLMDRVWGECPPQRGRAALYSYVSRLRTVFAAEPMATIERRPGGYVLTIDPLSVDLHRFRKLINDARLAVDDTRAVALFDEALRWWRGTPFAGLDTAWLASVRTALEVERQAAQLDRTDAALRCGQHTHLLAELSTRAATRPLDERIAGQLMLALAGAGRPADALATYQHTRRALCDELGLEPGPELRRLHENILAGDQQPLLPTPGERVSPAVVPHQLPAAARHFTGRHAELDTLTGLLGSTGATGDTVVISAIDGMAGVGKTALTVYAAHRLADRFPDGVLFSDLRGFTPEVDPAPPGQVLDHLLRGLGVPAAGIPPDLDARAGLYRSVLAGRRMLIVLDNAADEAQLQPLLPATVGCRVIVTSRRRLVGLDDAVHLSLPVLDPVDAARLFRDLAGDRAASADRPVVDRIVTLCGQLPLAIRITAARLRAARPPPPPRCAPNSPTRSTPGAGWPGCPTGIAPSVPRWPCPTGISPPTSSASSGSPGCIRARSSSPTPWRPSPTRRWRTPAGCWTSCTRRA
ncbi:MAG TPA: BTAD domain-containing putative transcriptional regulator [Pseudonocardiaceae bacterium]|nr:BTAD domain-containing putative transcriptional regulator [Pseudonocardiaceae bacterium]